jgi:Raf kinase inhibitor-like YbhB/YbcL family protein
MGRRSQGTQSLAVIMDDPDAPAGTRVHWVIYNIPAASTGLAENQPQEANLPEGILQGINDGKYIGYMGPCPPSGIHRYFVKLYALDCIPARSAGLDAHELDRLIARFTSRKSRIFRDIPTLIQGKRQNL